MAGIWDIAKVVKTNSAETPPLWSFLCFYLGLTDNTQNSRAAGRHSAGRGRNAEDLYSEIKRHRV